MLQTSTLQFLKQLKKIITKNGLMQTVKNMKRQELIFHHLFKM